MCIRDSLNADANAINLRWFVQGEWFEADVSKSSQDTSIPGSSSGGGSTSDRELSDYLGGTALYFTLKDTLIPEEEIIFELTYVELLKYEFGIVNFEYPANYNAFPNNGAIEKATFNFSVESGRTITSIECENFRNALVQNSGNNGSVQLTLNGVVSSLDYTCLLYTSPSPRDATLSRMPSSA